MPEFHDERLLNAFAHSRFGSTREAVAFRPRQGRSVSGLVTLSGGQRVFVKQDLSSSNSLLEREAAMLTALAALPDIRFVPELIEFDQEQKILITAAAEGCASLDRVLIRDSLSDPLLSVAAAADLAKLHGMSDNLPTAGLRRIGFPLEPVLPLTPEEFVARPAGYVHLAATLRQSRDSIDALAARWRSTHLIHGDFKADNLLIRRDPRITDRGPLVIVDWEMAGVGDPMWDAGSFVGSLLLAWIQALAPRAAVAAVLAGQDADAVCRQIGYFLLTYRHMAEGIFDATESFSLVVFQHAGIYMLHRVTVGLDSTGLLNPIGALLLEFARGLINQPQAAVDHLLKGMDI